MNRTKIEWCDYTINPIKGICKHGCWYCYAEKMYRRFKWNPKVRYDKYEIYKAQGIQEPSKIFICSTHDIMGEWVPDKWIQDIIDFCYLCDYHTFIFLTKNPKRYVNFKFPKNCWLGMTITGLEDDINWLWNSYSGMDNIKFVSLEPLLNFINIYDFLHTKPNWIIVGGLTPKSKHKLKWVETIIKQTKENNIPIFLKDNLHFEQNIKEFPN